MKKVLVINSSAKLLDAQSRKLTELFVNHWKNNNSDSKVTYRELGNTDVPHITEDWIAAAFKPEALRTEEDVAALKTSDTYIAELREADVIVLGSPMYNWSIPSSLKAYIDQIVRVKETFGFNRANREYPYVGLLEGKTLVLLLSTGEEGYHEGGYNQHLNFQSTYLTAIFKMIGISDSHLISVNRASGDAGKFEGSVEAAYQDIKMFVEQYVNQS